MHERTINFRFFIISIRESTVTVRFVPTIWICVKLFVFFSFSAQSVRSRGCYERPGNVELCKAKNLCFLNVNAGKAELGETKYEVDSFGCLKLIRKHGWIGKANELIPPTVALQENQIPLVQQYRPDIAISLCCDA